MEIKEPFTSIIKNEGISKIRYSWILGHYNKTQVLNRTKYLVLFQHAIAHLLISNYAVVNF